MNSELLADEATSSPDKSVSVCVLVDGGKEGDEEASRSGTGADRQHTRLHDCPFIKKRAEVAGGGLEQK